MSSYRPQAEGTPEAVDRAYFELGRRLTPLQRLQIAVRACQAQHRLQIAGLRLRHPDASEEELFRRAGALRLGRELTLRCFGEEAEAWFD